MQSSSSPIDAPTSQMDTNSSLAPDRASTAAASRPLRESDAVASTSSNGRVAPSPSLPLATSAAAVESTGNDVQGTAENPLIPKRRRRTTPTELAILEQEYCKNPRPDQPERAKIAQRLGMTNRAIQVWYQNRRQKDKKDSSSNAGSRRGSSVVSGGDLSSPKDLDGVTLSFSSSPVPSPPFSVYASSAPNRPPLVASSSSFSLKALPSSSDLYSNAPPSISNKENASVSPVDSSSPTTEEGPKPYVYSYPSSKESIAAYYRLAENSASSSTPSSNPHQPIFIHRASDASVIAAKKHVRKRPLGSHAPVARTPSLSHAFAFPPSPPKPPRSATVPPRSSSVGCLPSTTAAQINLSDLTARRSISGRRITSVATLFGLQDGQEEEVLSLAKDAHAKAPRQDEGTEAADNQGGRGGEKKAAAEDLLQHMESDPPSASSPAPIARTRDYSAKNPLQADDSDEDDKTSGSFNPSTFGTRRPPLQHTQSLGSGPCRLLDSRGGDPSKAKARVALLRSNSFSGSSSQASSSPLSISPSLANSHARSNPFSPLSAPLSSRTIPRKSPSLASAAEAARAGTDNACALSALERKRARIISDGLPFTLPSLPPLTSSSSSSSSSSRRKSHQDPVKERATKRRRSSALSSATVQQYNDSVGDESIGDLSFSSTSTASTVDSLATIDSPPPCHPLSRSSLSGGGGGYFALKSAVEQVEGRETFKAGDDERECAELLLGLGGFF